MGAWERQREGEASASVELERCRRSPHAVARLAWSLASSCRSPRTGARLTHIAVIQEGGVLEHMVGRSGGRGAGGGGMMGVMRTIAVGMLSVATNIISPSLVPAAT